MWRVFYLVPYYKIVTGIYNRLFSRLVFFAKGNWLQSGLFLKSFSWNDWEFLPCLRLPTLLKEVEDKCNYILLVGVSFLINLLLCHHKLFWNINFKQMPYIKYIIRWPIKGETMLYSSNLTNVFCFITTTVL